MTTQTAMKIQLKKNEILVLRTCNKDYTSRDKFKYPKNGMVTAPDFAATYECGNGLHGLPWGVGGDYLDNYNSSAIWQVLIVNTNKNNYLTGKDELQDKCKFKTGNIIYSGIKQKALEILLKYAPKNTPINYLNQDGCDYSTQTAGWYSTQTAGNDSTQTACAESTQTAGLNSVQIIHWYDENGKYQVTTRVITEKEADKAYKFYDGDWHLIEP